MLGFAYARIYCVAWGCEPVQMHPFSPMSVIWESHLIQGLPLGACNSSHATLIGTKKLLNLMDQTFW